jgi:hypothetical protein
MFTQNNSTPTIKEAFELIPPPEEYTLVEHNDEDKKDPNIWLVFLFLVIFYIALNLIYSSVSGYISSRYYGGEAISWKGYIFFSVIFVFITVVYVSLVGITPKGYSL